MRTDEEKEEIALWARCNGMAAGGATGETAEQLGGNDSAGKLHQGRG